MKKAIKQYSVILIGVIMTAFSISVFYTPNKIVSGGVSGLSTILYHVFKIQPGLSYAVINLILILISLKTLGKKFVVNSLIGAGLISLFVQIFTYIPLITDNIFLASFFGAIFYGIGIGLTLVQGASTGGTDILSRLIQAVFPHIKIGKLLLGVDAAVIIISLIVFKTVELALFGIIALMVSTYAIDWLIRKLNISKLAFIVTDKGEEISKFLVSTSPRGVTLIDVKGAYTMDKKTMLVCALKENEISEFQRKVTETDKNSFIIYSESQQIVGNGFYVYH